MEEKKSLRSLREIFGIKKVEEKSIQFRQSEIEMINFGRSDQPKTPHATLCGKVRCMLEDLGLLNISIKKEILKMEAPLFVVKTTITYYQNGDEDCDYYQREWEGIGVATSTIKEDSPNWKIPNDDKFPLDKAVNRSMGDCLSSMGIRYEILGVEPQRINNDERKAMFGAVGKFKDGKEWLQVFILCKFRIEHRDQLDQVQYKAVMEIITRLNEEKIKATLDKFYANSPELDPRSCTPENIEEVEAAFEKIREDHKFFSVAKLEYDQWTLLIIDHKSKKLPYQTYLKYLNLAKDFYEQDSEDS